MIFFRSEWLAHFSNPCSRFWLYLLFFKAKNKRIPPQSGLINKPFYKMEFHKNHFSKKLDLLMV